MGFTATRSAKSTPWHFAEQML
ncbi:hypothetical protein Godav_022523, partial [Gossypium davidsonii]|nr:hypothetical protein [Gossypium davidsonii]